MRLFVGAAQTATGALIAGMRVVALDGDVLEAEIEERAHGRIEPQPRQRPRLAGELQARLFEVVEVEMRVAEGVHEVARLKPRDCAIMWVRSA